MAPISWNSRTGELSVSGWALAPLGCARALAGLDASCALPRWLFLRLLGIAHLMAFTGWCIEQRAILGEDGLSPAFSLQQLNATIPCCASLAGLAAAVALLVNFRPRLALIACSVCSVILMALAPEFIMPLLDFPLLGISVVATSLAPRGTGPGLAQGEPGTPASLALLRLAALAAMVYAGVSGELQSFGLDAANRLFPTRVGLWLAQAPASWAWASSRLISMTVGVLLPFAALFAGRPRSFAVATWLGYQLLSALSAHSGWLNVVAAALGILLLDDRHPSKPPAPPRGAGSRTALALALLTAVIFGAFFASAPVCRNMRPGLLHFEGGTVDSAWRSYEFRNLPQLTGAACPVFLPCFSRFEAAVQIAASCGNDLLIGRVGEALISGKPAVLSLFRNDPAPAHPNFMVRTPVEQFSFNTFEAAAKNGNVWRRAILRNQLLPIAYDAHAGKFYSVWTEISGSHSVAR